MRLSKLSVDGLITLLRDIEELEPAMDGLEKALETNAISGRVLLHCDLMELKSVSITYVQSAPHPVRSTFQLGH